MCKRKKSQTFPIGSFIFIEFSLLIYLEIIFDRTGGTNCIRCFELTLRSLNVVQIHTEGLDKCYTTEEAAINKATCSTDESIATGKTREIMLYSEFSKPYTFTCYLVFMNLLCEVLPPRCLFPGQLLPFGLDIAYLLYIMPFFHRHFPSPFLILQLSFVTK